MEKLKFDIPCYLGWEKTGGGRAEKAQDGVYPGGNGRVCCVGTLLDVARPNLNLCCRRRAGGAGEFSAISLKSCIKAPTPSRGRIGFPRRGEFPEGLLHQLPAFSIPACQSIIKKAVSAKLGQVYGVEWLPETGSRYQIQFSIMKDTVSLCLDTSGSGLYKRGYRAVGVEAPLRETLAAAMVLLSGYKGLGPPDPPSAAAAPSASRRPSSPKTVPPASTAPLPPRSGRFCPRSIG